ncbi:hypothetical protein [Chitinophaga sp. RAB17]|uniref:hypothetical protein n=1 Tax=Chitinophaga sp. RAB17 TaxID=3233049 RepID=UPI003F8E3CE7
MKNLIPIIAGITLPVFFTENTHAQNKQQTVPGASTLRDSQPDTVQSQAFQYLPVTGNKGLFFLALSDKTILQGMDGALASPYPGVYQHAGDHIWPNNRMIQTLIKNGFIREAVDELKPMTNYVIAHQDFNEWYNVKTGTPKGSGNFRGEAGVLPDAITQQNGR